MVERKHFRTKLCVSYQRGRCTRQNCSFAHGSAELRQFVGSYTGKRDYRGGDLRDKLDKRVSPRRRYSPGKDAGNKRKLHGSSPSRSLEYNSDRKRKKEQKLDGQTDFFASEKFVEGTEDRFKDQKSALFDSRIALREKIKVQSDVNMLDYRRSQLRVLLEEKVKEEDNLKFKIQELNVQLAEEKEECKRIASKIRKFLKAHRRHKQAQDELRRSEAQLKKLGDRLGSALSSAGGDEEDSSINIVSDGGNVGHKATVPEDVFRSNSSPGRKSLPVRQDSSLEVKKGLGVSANLIENRGYQYDLIKQEKLSQFNEDPAQSIFNKGNELPDSCTGGCGPVGTDNLKTRRSDRTRISHAQKKGPGSVVPLPSTSMAAHVMDELAENEMGENVDDCGAVSTAVEKEACVPEIKRFPSLVPPPPVPQHAYFQYEAEDEHVDIGGSIDEMVEVDIV